MSGEPMTSRARWTASSGLSMTMSVRALASIIATGRRTVATVTAKPGCFSRSSEARFSTSSEARSGTMVSGGRMSTQRAA